MQQGTKRWWTALSGMRRLGPKEMLAVVQERFLVKEELMLGLRCDLASLPPPKPAKALLTGKFEDPTAFSDFDIAASTAQAADYLDINYRQRLCAAGVRELFVARLPGGRAAYTQWCVDSANLPFIKELSSHRYRELGPREVLLEGAYTFPAARGIGAMSDGSGQLLRAALATGTATAVTYVAATNIPSLRGCAAVGFTLDHTRVDCSRFGRRRSSYGEITEPARAAWQRANRR